MDILRDIPIVIHGRIFFLPPKGHLCGVALILDVDTLNCILEDLPLYLKVDPDDETCPQAVRQNEKEFPLRKAIRAEHFVRLLM